MALLGYLAAAPSMTAPRHGTWPEATVGEVEHAPPLRRLVDDPDAVCRDRARQALNLLAERLDRPL
jgi:hypothetical protein